MKRKKIEENIFDNYKVRLTTTFLIVVGSLLFSALMICILEFLINLI
jgi:hypothetical protein